VEVAWINSCCKATSWNPRIKSKNVAESFICGLLKRHCQYLIALEIMWKKAVVGQY
jgi:hypothetical protein